MRLARTSGAMPLSPQTILIALFLLFASTASAASAVLGLDFGTLNLKAALVKPGIPLEIVLTKDSKRKETAAVAFKPTLDSKKNIIAELGSYPERIYGGDALALQGRIPGDVFPNLKPLLGLASSAEAQAAISTYNSRYPALRVQYDDALGTSVLKSSAFAESEADWTVEQLLAMELSNVKHNAELMAGSRVSDAVITVPAFYTVEERRSIHTAAALAGLEVNALVSDGLAVGLDYAKSRVFPDVSKGEKPEINVVYDMGAGSTTATVLRLQSKNVKDVGRFNKTVQEVAVLGYGWDRTLGGDALNKVVLDHYMNELMEKSDVKSERADVLSNGRVLSRIWKEAEKARQVLSANTETSIGFEEILPGVDLRVKLSRSDFETMAAEYVDRVVKPLEDALSNAKISIDEVDSVILHGGCIRTPLVQKKLEEFVGGKAILRSNVNADESAVFGAAFKGAGLSPSFKVKEIRDSDIAGYVSGISFLDGGKQRKQNLFTVNSPVGNGATIKAVTFKDKQDFSFDIWQQVEGQERPLLGVQSTNLTASVQALQDNFGCTKEEISTRFNLRLGPVDGLPEVSGASVSCEVVGSGKGVGDSVK